MKRFLLVFLTDLTISSFSSPLRYSLGLFKQLGVSMLTHNISHKMGSKTLFFIALLSLSAISAFADAAEESASAGPGLVMNFYKDSCPQAEDIIKEQVQLLYKRHKNTAFSWLRNIFHDCAVQVFIYSFNFIYMQIIQIIPR